MQAPTLNAITQKQHGDYNAVDYDNDPNPNIYAPEDGTILSYALNGNCGNNLQFNGATGRHGFCHLESTTVKAGDKVKRGQVIGKMGYTGYTEPDNVPAGAHLHWVLYRNGVYVYPPNYINESFIGGNVSADKATREEVDRQYLLGLGRHADASGFKNFVGKPINYIADAIRKSAEWKARDAKAKAPSVYEQVKETLFRRKG